MLIFGLGVAIFFGLIFGSFGSVLLSRRGDAVTWRQASSILRGWSECPHCKHRLQAWDLVPLLSFFLQKGKCRYCRRKISWLYPILELGSALIFWVIYWYLNDWELGVMLFWVLQAWILWLLLIFDVLWYEVHMPLVMIGMLVALGAMVTGHLPWTLLWGAVSFFVFFYLMYWGARVMVWVKYQVKEEGIWMGDVLISPYLGFLLYAGLPASLMGIDRLLAFLLFITVSGAIGIVWYYFQNQLFNHKPKFLPQKMADKGVPLLPAMILAVAIVVVFQAQLFSFFTF